MRPDEIRELSESVRKGMEKAGEALAGGQGGGAADGMRLEVRPSLMYLGLMVIVVLMAIALAFRSARSTRARAANGPEGIGMSKSSRISNLDRLSERKSCCERVGDCFSPLHASRAASKPKTEPVDPWDKPDF